MANNKMVNIRIYGSSERWHGSYTDSGDNAGYVLKDCPWCRTADNLRICNTHTPYFWIECDCGADKYAEGVDWAETAVTREDAYRGFCAALENAVTEWNDRDGE